MFPYQVSTDCNGCVGTVLLVARSVLCDAAAPRDSWLNLTDLQKNQPAGHQPARGFCQNGNNVPVWLLSRRPGSRGEVDYSMGFIRLAFSG